MMPIIVPVRKREPEFFAYARINREAAIEATSSFIKRAKESHELNKQNYIDYEIKAENKRRSKFPWKFFYKQLSPEEGKKFVCQNAGWGIQFFTLGHEPVEIGDAKDILHKAQNSTEETIIVRADKADKLGLLV